MRSVLALAALVLASVAVQAEEPEPPRPPEALAGMAREVLCARHADAVVSARVVEVHPSPGVWCGIAETRQEVTWEITAVLDGVKPPVRVRVGHLLVFGSPLADRKEARLAPDLVKPGWEALLLLERHDDRWLVQDETWGVRFLPQ